MTEAPDLLAQEIAAHQFTEILQPRPEPAEPKARAAAQASGKVWYRVGYICTCCPPIFDQVEQEMLLRGLISNSLDFYQLGWSHAAASVGTHSLGACFDTAQFSPEQIDIWRLHGMTVQHRTTAQGFSMDHGHGFPNGCPHGSPAEQGQQLQWNNRQNGLMSHGPIAGRWPIDKWQTALTKRGKIIMALIDDFANRIKPQLDAIQNKVNGLDNKDDIALRVWNKQVVPTADNKSTWAAGSYLPSLWRHIHAAEAQCADINKKLDALTAAVAALKAGQK